MKICHVIYIPRLSGAETLVRDLAIHHSAEGHHISVLSIDPPEDSFNPILGTLHSKNIKLVMPEKKMGKLDRLQFLMRSLEKIVPDVIVAHAIIPSAYARLALKFSHLSSVPVVSVLHDASQNDYSSAYFRLIERILSPADCIIPLTEKAQVNYQKYFGSRSKLKVIPNGIDVKSLKSSAVNRNQVRDKVFNVINNEFIFLQVGRFNRNKQQHLSIEAFIQACNSDEDFHGKLFLAGVVEDQSYFAQLQKTVSESQLQEKVIFLGPRSDIPDLLWAADVYLMPSSIEAHSIAFLEALASGITMVISDIPAFKRGKKFEGVTALNPENTQLFSKILIELKKCKSTKFWQRDLSNFSIEKTADAYLSVFQCLLAV